MEFNRIREYDAVGTGNLYWIIIKEPNDVSLFSGNTYLEGREPTVVKLDLFFQSLPTDYSLVVTSEPRPN